MEEHCITQKASPMLNFFTISKFLFLSFQFKFPISFLWVMVNWIQIHIQGGARSSIFHNFAWFYWPWWIDCKNNDCFSNMCHKHKPNPLFLQSHSCQNLNFMDEQKYMWEWHVRWVNDDKTFIFGWTGPLTLTFKHIKFIKPIYQKYMLALCVRKHRDVPE